MYSVIKCFVVSISPLLRWLHRRSYFYFVTCLYLHFIIVDWVFLGNLLKSLYLSLYWDSFLGQDHCLHMTYSFCSAASFDGMAVQRPWILCFAKVGYCFIFKLGLQCRKLKSLLIHCLMCLCVLVLCFGLFFVCFFFLIQKFGKQLCSFPVLKC